MSNACARIRSRTIAAEKKEALEPPTTPARRGSINGYLRTGVRSAPAAATAPAVALPPRSAGGGSWRWPVGCVLAVLYTSLLPFNFSFTTVHRPISDGLWSLRFRPTTPDEAAANLLVYLPLGLVLGLMAMRRQCGRWIGVLAATIVGGSLGILVETLQTCLESRVASCTDILLNCVGAAIGACLGVGLSGSAEAAMAQVRSELADRPFTTAASLLTLGLFLYNLTPFDFVTTTDALHASFGRAHWSLMSAHVTAVGAPPFAAIAYQLTGAGWFAVLGYLLALGGRERGRHSALSLGSALKNGLILVALVEFMQLFTQSHTFESATVLIRSFGVAFGAWCALFLIDPLTGSTWFRRPTLAVPTFYMPHNHSRVVVLMAILAVFQVGLLIAPCVNPQGGLFSNERPIAVRWLPFETLWRQSLHTAAAEVLSSLLTFATLTLTLVVLLRRFRVVYARWWTFAALTVVAITCEGLRLATLGTPMDVTALLLAWLSVYLVASMPGALGVAAAVRDATIPGPCSAL